MDGDYVVTVEKLLIYNIGGTKSDYKWIHQLDFATSGILCIALNKLAANISSKAFEMRKTYKEYIALLYGDLNISSFPCKNITEEELLMIRQNFQVKCSNNEIKCLNNETTNEQINKRTIN